jgi:NitT/TauT family transport system substrate-binding protein
MSKVVGMSPADYKVFLPGTRFFDTTANLDAFNAASPSSLIGVAPQISGFLLANRLIDGKPDATRGVDSSILAAALKK